MRPYAAFYARNSLKVLAKLHPHVSWSRAWRGDYGTGHNEVRALAVSKRRTRIIVWSATAFTSCQMTDLTRPSGLVPFFTQMERFGS